MTELARLKMEKNTEFDFFKNFWSFLVNKVCGNELVSKIYEHLPLNHIRLKLLILETSQLIWVADQLTGFYINVTLTWYELIIFFLMLLDDCAYISVSSISEQNNLLQSGLTA